MLPKKTDNHRKRIKKRFIKAEKSAQSEAVLIELLLTYGSLNRFHKTLRQAKMPDGRRFPKSLSVNKGILHTIPDDEFKELIKNEAKRPEPTAAHVGKAFETFLRSKLKGKGLIILSNLELLFAYNLELNLLRTMATDDDRILLLLPGRRAGGSIIMFPESDERSYTLTTNLIASGHLWELKS